MVGGLKRDQILPLGLRAAPVAVLAVPAETADEAQNAQDEQTVGSGVPRRRASTSLNGRNGKQASCSHKHHQATSLPFTGLRISTPLELPLHLLPTAHQLPPTSVTFFPHFLLWPVPMSRSPGHDGYMTELWLLASCCLM